MKDFFKRAFRIYAGSWWLPSFVALLMLPIFGTAVLSHSTGFERMLADIALALVGLALLGILVSALWNLARKQWARAVINFALFCMLGLYLFTALFGLRMFGAGFESVNKTFSPARGMKVPPPLC